MRVKRRILIGEDNQDIRDSLNRWFNFNFPFLEKTYAEDGAELVRMVEEYNPDIILSDNSMPVKTGYQAIAEIRDSGYRKPILMYTSNPDLARQKLQGIIDEKDIIDKSEIIKLKERIAYYLNR